MSEITAEIDKQPFMASVNRFLDEGELRTKAAAEITANNIQNGARQRARRQLRNPTGVLEAGIIVRDDREDVGFIVQSVYRDARQMYNVPIWVERGTKRGKPRSHDEPARPFFWPSVTEEIRPHERRIADAMDQSLNAEGLGD